MNIIYEEIIKLVRLEESFVEWIPPPGHQPIDPSSWLFVGRVGKDGRRSDAVNGMDVDKSYVGIRIVGNSIEVFKCNRGRPLDLEVDVVSFNMADPEFGIEDIIKVIRSHV